MATTVPEFISVLRDIRDNKYPQISTWYASISEMNTDIIAIQENVIAIQADVTNKNTSIKNISVVSPVTTVPNNPNGSAGSANVVYNPVTNQFTFAVPIGPEGKSMRIDYTVALITDKYLLTVNTGDIVFVEENSSNYVKLGTGVNTGASDWSDAIPIVPARAFTELNDTPSTYANQTGKVPVVSSDETALVFMSPAEIGVIGYNYVENPLFANTNFAMPIITNVAFGSDKRGYGTFDTVTGTPTLASDHVRVSNGVTIANTDVYTSGKAGIGVRVQLESTLANSTIVNCGNMRLFLNGSSNFAVTDGTTTNSLTVGMTPNITDVYEIFATDQDLIVLNMTTGLMASSSLVLTVPTQTSGSIILGGDGLTAKFYAITVADKTTYTQVDGVYEEFAQGWLKSTTGGEMYIVPDIEGADKGMRFVAGALPSISKVRMFVGEGGQFSGKKVTLSFTAYSSGVGANSIDVDFVTDRGSQIVTSRLLTQNVATAVLDNGIEKNYSLTFDADTISESVFLDSDANDYFELTLPSSANYWINVKKPKFEISAVQTEFTPQGGQLSILDLNKEVAKLEYKPTINNVDGVLIKDNEDSGLLKKVLWKDMKGGATGGGNDEIFIMNGKTVTTNFTIPAGQNAGSFGSITISDGVTVTIPDTSSWTIV